jgi:hypothetical protein
MEDASRTDRALEAGKGEMLAGNEMACRLGIHRFRDGRNRNRNGHQRTSDTHHVDSPLTISDPATMAGDCRQILNGFTEF